MRIGMLNKVEKMAKQVDENHQAIADSIANIDVINTRIDSAQKECDRLLDELFAD